VTGVGSLSSRQIGTRPPVSIIYARRTPGPYAGWVWGLGFR
jgi:hypothetical protein